MLTTLTSTTSPKLGGGGAEAWAKSAGPEAASTGRTSEMSFKIVIPLWPSGPRRGGRGRGHGHDAAQVGGGGGDLVPYGDGHPLLAGGELERQSVDVELAHGMEHLLARD